MYMAAVSGVLGVNAGLGMEPSKRSARVSF